MSRRSLDECRDNTAGMLRELATVWHKEAQKTALSWIPMPMRRISPRVQDLVNEGMEWPESMEWTMEQDGAEWTTIKQEDGNGMEGI